MKLGIIGLPNVGKSTLFNAGFGCPVYQVCIDLPGQFLRTGASDQGEGRFLLFRAEKISGGNAIECHSYFSSIKYMLYFSNGLSDIYTIP